MFFCKSSIFKALNFKIHLCCSLAIRGYLFSVIKADQRSRKSETLSLKDPTDFGESQTNLKI
jgi:hypothetical protein